jgi:hypothetical protein
MARPTEAHDLFDAHLPLMRCVQQPGTRPAVRNTCCAGAACSRLPLGLLSRDALSARRRSLSPHPKISNDFYGRREDQHAKGGLGKRFHRPLDQEAMGDSRYDDDHREERMGDPPGSGPQS